jgi:hypothetical protein
MAGYVGVRLKLDGKKKKKNVDETELEILFS